MLIKVPRGWEIPESASTPERAFTDRRALLKALGLGTLIAAGAALPIDGASASDDQVDADPSVGLYPAKRNPKYSVDRAITDPKYSTNYNNFYEYGADKGIAGAAQQLKIRPWTITIDGMVEKPITIEIDDLLKLMPLEERIYRHRCVEPWSMVVPWSGFPLKSLVDFAKPLSSASYLHMASFKDVSMAPGQKIFWFPWPYLEGLTMAEATHELAFVVTGMYGQPVPKQDGAPLRLAIPWKYGFKSVKSIVKFTFTDQRPKTFWETLMPAAYGFWANINPDVANPNWTQATELVLGTNDHVPTVIWNGYGDFVASLYTDLKGEQLFS